MPFTPDKPESNANQTTPGFISDNENPSNTKIPTYDEIIGKPGPAGDMLRKTVTGIQSGGVGEFAAPLGGLVSSAGSKLAGLFKPASARSAVLSQVKNEAGLGDYVANQISEASEKFNKKQISPRMLEQYARADQQSIPFNPNDYKGIHPDIDAQMAQIEASGAKELPMKEALGLRAKLNDRTLFKDLGPYSDQVAAKQSAALDAGNKLRDQLSSVDPNIGMLSDELKDAYSMRKAALGSAGKRPITATTASLGTDKAATLAKFDEAAGTDLRGLGKNIRTASDRLGGYSGGVPTSVPAIAKQAMGVAPRAYDALAEFLNPATQAAGNALQSPIADRVGQLTLQGLLQRKNK